MVNICRGDGRVNQGPQAGATRKDDAHARRPWTVLADQATDGRDGRRIPMCGLRRTKHVRSPGCSRCRRCPPHLPPSPSAHRLSLQSPLQVRPRLTPRRPAHLSVMQPTPSPRRLDPLLPAAPGHHSSSRSSSHHGHLQLCKQVDSWLKRSSTIRVMCTTSPSSAVVVGGRGCRCGDYYCHQRQDHFTRSSQHGSSFWLRGSLLSVFCVPPKLH